jgi:hypothetical protein
MPHGGAMVGRPVHLNGAGIDDLALFAIDHVSGDRAHAGTETG